MSAISLSVSSRGIARLVMNRPDLHNAFDEALIGELTAAFEALGADPAVRVVVLAAAGKSFSAGADLDWMRRMASATEADNLADAGRLGRLMRTLHTLPKPTIAAVQGAAFGGGVGLVACCDMAIASTAALFSLSEVRLGLIPAVISPYVIAAIGTRGAGRYFISAERFDAAEALRLGLLHQVVAAEELDSAVQGLAERLLEGGPAAQAGAKRLINEVAGRPLDQSLVDLTASRIAAIRATPEAREGIAAFLEKRPAAWKRT